MNILQEKLAPLAQELRSAKKLETSRATVEMRKGLKALSPALTDTQVKQLAAAAPVWAELVRKELKGNQKPEARAAVAAATWIANAVSSVADAHQSHDLESCELMNVRREALAKWTAVSAALEGDTDGEHTEVLSISLENLPDRYFAQKYTKFKAKLPKLTSKERMVAVRLPVVAIFGGFVKVQDVADEGFDVSDDGGYIVFQDQLIWCINNEALDKDPTWEGSEKQYVQKMISAHKKRTGVDLEPQGVDNHQEITHSGMNKWSFFWMMPRNEARQLPTYISQWGFPFSS